VATSEADRFEAFFRMLGHRLEDFQRLIVEELFSERRETLVLIPRGNGKSTLLAAVGLWSLPRKPDVQIVPNEPEAGWRRIGKLDPRSGAWVDGPHWRQPHRPWRMGR
jgi:reverse gyrase